MVPTDSQRPCTLINCLAMSNWLLLGVMLGAASYGVTRSVSIAMAITVFAPLALLLFLLGAILMLVRRERR